VNSSQGTRNSDFSPEMQLLMLCCRSNLEKNYGELTGFISQQPIDWTGFTILVAKHRMFPQIHQVFLRCRQIIPAQTFDEIAGHASKNLKKMLNLAGELDVLYQLFGNHHIGFISMKGPLMVRQLYGDYSCRQTRDLDILVELKDIDRAISVLSGSGYILVDKYFSKNPEKRTLYLKRENHVRFRHPGKMIFIELHWSVSKYFTTIKTEVLFRNKIAFSVQGKEYNTISPSDYFIVLATHGVYHRYELLFWLYDIGHLLTIQGLNREELRIRAEQFKCTTSVKVSIALACSFFDLNIPGFEPQGHNLTSREQFIYNQCIETINSAGSAGGAGAKNSFLQVFRQRVAQQRYLMLMTDDWQSKKRVMMNTLIKSYVWEESSNIPKNNFIYLFLTQIKWVKLMLSGRMKKSGRIQKS
jgi:hypothetical protein